MLLCYRDYITAIANQDPTPYEGDVNLPIFCNIRSGQKRLFSVQAIATCLLHPNINRKFVCEHVPITISHNVCFLVDTSKLDDPEDLQSDDMGSWKHNGVDTTYWRVNYRSLGIATVVKAKPTTPGVYRLKRCYRTHNSDSSLKKITASIFGVFSCSLFFLP